MDLDENVMTAMVDGAAKGLHGRSVEVMRQTYPEPITFPEWDDLPPLEKNRWRQQVLMVVWDAVAAMPDIRHAIWEEACAAAYAKTPDIDSRDWPENPYPSPIA